MQLGTVAPGVKLRWRFASIRPESFLWLGEISQDDGKTWRLQVEVFARRGNSLVMAVFPPGWRRAEAARFL